MNWLRWTLGFRKIDGRWRVAHEHVSVPFDMESGKAMLDLKPATSLTDAFRERDRLDETLLRQLAVPHSCGLHLLAAPPDAVEAAQVSDEVIARVLTLRLTGRPPRTRGCSSSSATASG